MKNILSRVVTVFARKGPSGLAHSLSFHLASLCDRFCSRAWIKRYTPAPERLAAMVKESEDFSYKPLFSIVLPVYNPDPIFLREALDSVLRQVYPHWELCAADDASAGVQAGEILREYAQKDARIKVTFRSENGHIAAASNSALDLAQGEFIALLDHDDRLAPHALYEMAAALNREPGLDMLYSNEDKINARGARMEPAFKPAWSPEYLLSFMYVGHLLVLRRSVVEQVGRFRAGYEGSQDYDLALRVSEAAGRVAHVPQILYHWRKHPHSVAVDAQAKPYAYAAAKKALQEAGRRRNFTGMKVEDTWAPGVYKSSMLLVDAPKVLALVYFSRENGIDQRLSAIREQTEYKQASFVAGVVDESAPGRCGVFSSLWEFVQSAAASQSADFCVLLDGGLLPRGRDWLEQLLYYALRSGVGLVGARISDAAGRCVHGGYTVRGTRAAHNGFGLRRFEPGYAFRMIAAHNVSAVSSMCMIACHWLISEGRIASEPFNSKLGFELALALEARAKGLRTVWTPHADLFGKKKTPRRIQDLREYPEDLDRLEKGWSLSGFVDPYYPPGLEAAAMNFKMECR